jgi:BirA family transcriptional regulator, biotin operon repressor / biotin---[acetyl-CoA-carboxylase] ligase
VTAHPTEKTDKHLDALLALLSENATFVVSGKLLAKELRVPHHSVWRMVQKLRALGVKVKGHSLTGYHIEGMQDVLTPRLLQKRLRGGVFGKQIHHYFRTDSTNNVAMRLGDDGEAHGALVIAEEQTSGRGRAGRKWVSEKGSAIYASVLVRPGIPPSRAPLLTIAAGLAAYDAVAEETGLEPDIRWPNDLLLGGKKCCGILSEMRAEPDRIHYAVVGIGLNVNQAQMPAEIAGVATSLRMATGRIHSRVSVLAGLLRHMERYYNQFLAEGGEPIVRRFAEVSSFYKGKRVRIATATEAFEGVTAGLEASGVLRVRREGGRIEPVLTGDVREVNECS